jgi:HAD superfamily phosphatase (TIGR01668 family)
MHIRSVPLHKQAAVSFKPDFIAASVADIDFGYLKRLGVTTCFVDLDGTVVSRGTFEVDPKLAAALKSSGLDIKIATNRPRSRSLKELKQDLSASGVIHPKGVYGKPAKRYFQNALNDLGLKPEQAVMIGDRFLQDIFGANRAGVYSLLVFKLGKSHDWFDSLLSKAERRLARRLEKLYQPLPK